MPPSKSAARAAASKVAKFDIRQSHPALYRAGRKIEEIRSPKGTFLAVDGVGEPGGDAFQQAVHRLFSLAYTTKFAIKKAGGADFSIPALECLWPEEICGKPMTEWRWRVMLRVAPCVKARGLNQVRRTLVEKKGLVTDDVKLITWTEGRALQVLHLGPYEGVAASYQKLVAEAAARGLICAGPPHELYLNDPRRVPPERIKTIVRLPVKRSPAS